jgi:hypothetical protein
LPHHGNAHISFHVLIYINILFLLKLKHNILQQNLSFLRLNKGESTASDARQNVYCDIKRTNEIKGKKRAVLLARFVLY